MTYIFAWSNVPYSNDEVLLNFPDFLAATFAALLMVGEMLSNSTILNYWKTYIFKCGHYFVQCCMIRSSPPEVFLGKGVLKISSKFTGEHPCRNAISIKLLCNFIEIPFRHGCSPVNFLHFFRTPFLKNNSKGLLIYN